VEELSGAVEKLLLDVVERYNLFKNDRIVVAYSGGIDSSALLAALASVYPELSVEIRTVTLENYWKENKVETKQGQNQADLFPPGVRETLDLSHTEISVTEIESVYGLNRPLPGVLREFNQQDLRLDTVSAANSINRRLFERHANRCGTDRICVGDHSTDIIAGIIGSLLTSAPLYRGQFPEHQIGKFSYIFPLAFHTKRELALYLQAHTGKTIEHTGFDPWEMNTAARHFYYYLADILQSFCPGLIYRLRDRSQDNLITDTQSCDNCGKIKIPSDLIDGRCEVCDAFGRIGAI
jgi:tRNA(Ile)-lysidine synthase TilS/MesJ